MSALVSALQFLADHADIIEAVADAIAGGSSKAAIIADIKAGLKARSDAQFEADLAAQK